MSGAVAATGMRGAGRYVVLAMLVFAAGLALAAVLGGGKAALAALQHVPPSILPVLLALSATNYALRAARWLLFSNALALRVPQATNVLYYVAGFAMTATPGKVGEALRLYLMNRSHGARYESTAALLVADRLSDAVAITAVVALTVAWFAHYLWLAMVSVAIVACIVLLALRPGFLLTVIDALFARMRRWPRLFVRARRAVRALQRLADPRIFGLALLLGMLGWCAEAASFAILLHALGVGVHPLAAAFIFSFGMMVGAISVLPGGLGSTEATMIGLLATQGVPFGTALVATGVVRLTTLWFAVALGFVALPVALGRAAPAREEGLLF
ncbi:MAG TPA: lysylphosphatidylglycerol synthase transmembrane domain-containing protein [Acetobacteraceae bacterium]|nr:lysylphosphatidylglycerol synthase transmembrane domain-containing protein [Acetobacteraceae bacterium]